MRKEAAASAEATEAEKAARWAAAAETKELQRLLKEANEALAKQQEFADRLGNDSEVLKGELQAALDSRTSLDTEKQGLTQVRNSLLTLASPLACLTASVFDDVITHLRCAVARRVEMYSDAVPSYSSSLLHCQVCV